MAFLLAYLALLTAAIFAGAAIYVGVAEHPARAHLDDRAALAHWKPSYRAATKMQASLALASGVLGLFTWSATGDARWALGSVLILANLPYTLAFMMPVNKVLEATPLEASGRTSRTLLARWSRLHRVRSALGIAASAAYVWALS